MLKRVIRVAVLGLLVTAFTAIQAADTVSACWKKDKGLVGWWKFDEGVGTFVGDSSGLGNDGNLHGDAAFTSNGLSGSAVDLFGGTGSVRVPHDSSLEPAVGTIEVWIKVADFQDSDVIMKTTTQMVRSQTSGSYSVYGMRVFADGSASVFIANDDPNAASAWTTVTSPPDAIALGEWHHIVMTWNGSVLALYVNGSERASSSYVPIPGSGLSYHSNNSDFGLGIGTYWGGSGHEYIGQLDEARVYSGVLSAKAIKFRYKARGRDYADLIKKKLKKKWKKCKKKAKKAKARQNKNGKWNNGKKKKGHRW